MENILSKIPEIMIFLYENVKDCNSFINGNANIMTAVNQWK